MNTQQRKYAIERVAVIQGIRKQSLRDAYRDAAKPALTSRERYLLVAKNAVPFSETVDEINRHTDAVHLFDFSEFEGHTTAQHKAHAADLDAVDREAARVKDMIMLGDAEEALRILTEFAEGAAR